MVGYNGTIGGVIMQLYQFLSNGGLSKTLSILLTFLLGIGSGTLLFVQALNGQQPNDIAVGILLSVLGVSSSTVGFHLGVNSTITGINAANTTPASVNQPTTTPSAPAPLVPPASTKDRI